MGGLQAVSEVSFWRGSSWLGHSAKSPPNSSRHRLSQVLSPKMAAGVADGRFNTPWKINGWHPKKEVDGKWFSFSLGWFFGWQPLIFRGVFGVSLAFVLLLAPPKMERNDWRSEIPFLMGNGSRLKWGKAHVFCVDRNAANRWWWFCRVFSAGCTQCFSVVFVFVCVLFFQSLRSSAYYFFIWWSKMAGVSFSCIFHRKKKVTASPKPTVTTLPLQLQGYNEGRPNSSTEANRVAEDEVWGWLEILS